MTKRLSTLVLFFLIRFVSFADIGCDAYKQQVVNDCNATISNVRLVSNDALAIINAVDLLKQDTNLSSYYGALDGISASANSIRGYCVTAVTSIESIRDTALSLQCTSNSSGSCNCTNILNDIYSELKEFNSSFQSEITAFYSLVEEYMVKIYDDFHDVLLPSLDSYFDSSYTYFGAVTNLVSSLDTYFNVVTNIPTKSKTYGYVGNSRVLTWANNRFSDLTFHLSDTYYSTGAQLIKGGILGNLVQLNQILWSHLGSLNNYGYTNTVLQTSINKELDSFSKSVKSGFSIFSVDSPLSIFQDGVGDYHSFLTNYYVRVSTGQTSGSASEPHTNWFSRIEMLLASLVFQPQGSNFVNDAGLDSQISQIQSSLDSSLDDLRSSVELPSGFEETIRSTGKSFLDVLGGFHDAISGNSLPSSFTLVDINLSNSRSSENLNRLTLETPVSGSFLSFLEVCHAVTTICFTMLFCYWSIKFVIFFCSKIAKLISVCFHVFASLIGSS